MSQGKSHQLGTWLEKTSVDGKVGRTSRQRLDVDTPFLAAESERLQGALLAESFDLVDDFITAIIALAGVALGVLICEAGA